MDGDEFSHSGIRGEGVGEVWEQVSYQKLQKYCFTIICDYKYFLICTLYIFLSLLINTYLLVGLVLLQIFWAYFLNGTCNVG
jgi:hypothetical protein